MAYIYICYGICSGGSTDAELLLKGAPSISYTHIYTYTHALFSRERLDNCDKKIHLIFRKPLDSDLIHEPKSACHISDVLQ